MPTPAYLAITGYRQGLISGGASTQESIGNLYKKGHENEILVQAYSHQIIIPRDPQSGQPTGKAVHKPFMISKVRDKSTPLILQALTTGEMLETCIIKWYETKSGQDEVCYSIELEDAVIVDVQSSMPSCNDPSMAHMANLEEVYFSYRKIIWTNHSCGTSGSADWRDPNQR